MNKRSILSVFGVLALLACSATNGAGSAPGKGTGANGAGASSGVGAGNSSSSGASGPDIKANDDAGPGSGDVMNGVCANQPFDLQRKPAEILIVLDRSGSMKDGVDGNTGSATNPSKWSLVVPGVNEVVTATDSSVSWGLKVFPESTGNECQASSVTSTIPVPIAPANAKAVTDAVTAIVDEGDGTPTGSAINAAVAYLETLTDPNPKFILLATDGEPSCADITNSPGTNSGAARTYAVTAIQNAAAAGFKTIVVGVATTKDTAKQALNDMAVAGQMPRADNNPLATKFYLATTKDELVASLQAITGEVASCVFDLTAVPPAPDNIAVHVNDTKAPHDPTKADGWDYTDSTLKQIQIYGSWCDQIKAANANTVNFVFGCPGQDPPA